MTNEDIIINSCGSYDASWLKLIPLQPDSLSISSELAANQIRQYPLEGTNNDNMFRKSSTATQPNRYSLDRISDRSRFRGFRLSVSKTCGFMNPLQLLPNVS
ncbi:hypothetical protein CDAR_541221 [Caerostris darwini]|uniref:Uncharacterized protein n=1 Tax=Caerostris darwini TaxID=1538125 RepID=A0AAV4QL09_9ARAC|nr:hypothetical protein CDAR_541221 [Caerostris darwini]